MSGFVVAFVVLSVPIVYVSRASLRAPGSHGFYRFFAWELIVALVLLDVPVWFHDPFTWHQVTSWVLLVVCFVPLVLGVRTLRSRGRPVEHREGDASLLAFEKTSTLVTTGIYHYIRHPLYCSLLVLAWGVFFKDPSWPGGLLVLAATLALIATAKADEAECTRFFGPAYRDYMERTRMFVPFLFLSGAVSRGAQTPWFAAAVCSHVVDLVNRYPSDQLPRTLTGYLRDRKDDDDRRHDEFGAANAAFITDDVVDRFAVVGAPGEHVRWLD